MPSELHSRRAVLGAMSALPVLAGLPSALCAQTRPLDVPFVPTPEHIVEAMLRLAKPTKDDYLVDLGCGDGRIPIMAATKYGVRGFGVDLNPERIKEARANAAKAGVTDMIEFVEGDLFKTDFKKATVLTMYLLPSVNMRLRPQVLDMRPGTRVVSHAFTMEDWKADISEQHDFRSVFFWVVPAKVAGRWSGTSAGAKLELTLQQRFQELTGSAVLNGRPATVTNAKISGEEIGLDLGSSDSKSSRLVARLKGAVLEGQGVSLRRL